MGFDGIFNWLSLASLTMMIVLVVVVVVIVKMNIFPNKVNKKT